MTSHKVLLGKYEVGEIIGQGTFGEVRKATHLDTGQNIAIKFEKSANTHQRLLFNESEALSNLQGAVGIPKLYAFGTQEECDFMVTELLGRNLLVLFKDCGKCFGLETVAKIACQAVDRIEHIHSRGYLHRDIKPENLLVGCTDKDLIYITDFGLAKKYVNLEFGMHIPFKQDKSFAGTLTYASLNAHLGLQQSRRDDLQSLFFVLLFFIKGKLLWQGAVQGKGIMRKILLSPAELFQGCPRQFEQAVVYIRSLQFEERPDYRYIKSLFAAWSQSSVVLDWLQTSDHHRRKRALTTAHIRSFPRKTFLSTQISSLKLRRSATNRQSSLTNTTDSTAQPKAVRFTLPCDSLSDTDSEGTVKEVHLPRIDRGILEARRHC